MKTIIFLLLIFCLLCSLVSSAQDSTRPKPKSFTGVRNNGASLTFIDNGQTIATISATGDVSAKDAFIKTSGRQWYIIDSAKALPVLMRMTELYFNLKTPKTK